MATIIRQATITDINELIGWRMRSLRNTLANTAGVSFSKLRQASINFYRRALSMETYIGCFADQGYTAVGYGGLCIYHETPTPDNPSGCCAHVMNVYTGPDDCDESVRRNIVDWLVDEAHRRGITKIYLSPRPLSPETIVGDFGAQAEA